MVLDCITCAYLTQFNHILCITDTFAFFSFAIQVIKALLEIGRKHSWAEIVRCIYRAPEKSVEGVMDHPEFLIEQVDLLGGIDFICLEVCAQLNNT